MTFGKSVIGSLLTPFCALCGQQIELGQRSIAVTDEHGKPGLGTAGAKYTRSVPIRVPSSPLTDARN